MDIVAPYDKNSTPAPSFIACTECGMSLPTDVYDAASVLYGPSSLRAERLAENIEREIKISKNLPMPRHDQTTARYALQDWLGIRSLESLTLAVLHQASGECARVQTDRIAADEQGGSL